MLNNNKKRRAMKKGSKPFIQKAYEKWAMLYKSITQINNKDLPFDGSISIMGGKGKDGSHGIYLCLVTDDGMIPLFKTLSEKECQETEPLFETSEPMTKMFYKALMTDKRETMEEFNSMDGPELTVMTPEEYNDFAGSL